MTELSKALNSYSASKLQQLMVKVSMFAHVHNFLISFASFHAYMRVSQCECVFVCTREFSLL